MDCECVSCVLVVSLSSLCAFCQLISKQQLTSRAAAGKETASSQYLYNDECKICKSTNECKHRQFCKLYVIKNDDEGIVKVKRTNVNAKMPVKGTTNSTGYDLAVVEAIVVPAHGKCLVKTGLTISLPPDCYGRIAPRSGIALKKFIDVGAGVIDSDYRGEIGVVLFNFGSENFVVNMGDTIAQLIFEKIKTPEIKETNNLRGPDGEWVVMVVWE